MASEIERKLEQVEKMIMEKFAEIKQLKALKKSYLIAINLEKKVMGKSSQVGGAEEQSVGSK